MTANAPEATAVEVVDLAVTPLRELNGPGWGFSAATPRAATG